MTQPTIKFCYECGQAQGRINGNTLDLSRHKLSCSFAKLPTLACDCAATGLHAYTDDITIMRTLRDVYLTATYCERNRHKGDLSLPFSETGLINECERAFADLTGRERRWRDVIDEACRSGDRCSHCGIRRNCAGLGGSPSHAPTCPHWKGGSC